MTKLNELDTITDDVIEAAASILVIENLRHRATTERRHIAPKVTCLGFDSSFPDTTPKGF
ncbi:hypothetical protein ACIQHF_01255 [Pseudarthrobacter oxydans]|uniref:hypothetical protein n=1 Tax=Pseudarthrobacter oxydans TaxID=1671 RepID=UPI003830CDB7